MHVEWDFSQQYADGLRLNLSWKPNTLFFADQTRRASGLGQGIMNATYKTALGVVVALSAMVLITYAYMPRTLRPAPPSLETLFVDPDCPTNTKLNIHITLDQPRLLASTSSANAVISGWSQCKRIEVSGTEDIKKVAIVRVGLGTQGLTKIIEPTTDAKLGKVYKLIPPDASPDWIVVVNGAFAGRRTGFANYALTAFVAFPKPVGARISAESNEDYELIGGDKVVEITVGDPKNETDFAHFISASARFLDIDGVREVFAILSATLFGIGISFGFERLSPKQKL